jgi:hypothetical protein
MDHGVLLFGEPDNNTFAGICRPGWSEGPGRSMVVKMAA